MLASKITIKYKDFLEDEQVLEIEPIQKMATPNEVAAIIYLDGLGESKDIEEASNILLAIFARAFNNKDDFEYFSASINVETFSKVLDEWLTKSKDFLDAKYSKAEATPPRVMLNLDRVLNDNTADTADTATNIPVILNLDKFIIPFFINNVLLMALILFVVWGNK